MRVLRVSGFSVVCDCCYTECRIRSVDFHLSSCVSKGVAADWLLLRLFTLNKQQ